MLILGEYVEKLREKLGDKLLKVILFGSYAKGLSDEFSDVDVLIVHRGREDVVRAAVADVTLDISTKYGIPLEPLTMSIHEFQEDTVFTREVRETGITLYAADPEEERVALALDYIPLIEEYLSYARESLEKGRYRLAVDLGYNAAELAVRALIALKGESFAKTHGGILAQFGRLYVEAGEVGRETGRSLHEALMLRNRARYDPRARLGKEDAEKIVELAETLLKVLKEKVYGKPSSRE